VLGVVFGVVLHATRSGRWVFAIGQSKDAARFVGILVGRSVLTMFIVNGLMAGLAGVVYTIRFASARPDGAVGMELEVIAAATVRRCVDLRRCRHDVGRRSLRALPRINSFAAAAQRRDRQRAHHCHGFASAGSVVIPAIAKRISDRRMAGSPPSPSPSGAASSTTANHTEHVDTDTAPVLAIVNPFSSTSPSIRPTTRRNNAHEAHPIRSSRLRSRDACRLRFRLVVLVGHRVRRHDTDRCHNGRIGSSATSGGAAGARRTGLTIAVIPKSINNAYFDAAFVGAQKPAMSSARAASRSVRTEATGAAQTEFINTEIRRVSMQSSSPPPMQTPSRLRCNRPRPPE
jgi:hypothetical protein